MSGSSRAGIIPPRSVKICGLREPEHAVAAVAAGADLLGFIFAPTRRYVPPEDARMAVAAARAAARHPVLTVGVFVDAAPEEMNRIAADVGLDLIQLSGDESPDRISALYRPVLRALRPKPGASAADVLSEIQGMGLESPAAYLLDGYHAGQFGGTGVRADWTVASVLAPEARMLLAGGLNPHNVAEAISVVNPLGVDVSSGVERDGTKDATLIAEFVRAAKAAFRAVP